MATRFWVGGGSSANWNATAPTNWAATSGGANNQSVPSTTDDVTFDGAGASGNTNSSVSSGITVLSLTFTSGYTAQLNIVSTLNVAGNFTDHTAHSYGSGTGALTISAASTITPNGKTFPNQVNFSNTNTKTLAGNWTIGLLNIQSGSPTVCNGNTITAAGLTMGATLSGTTSLMLSGSTWSGSSILSLPLTIAGNVTLSGSIAFAGSSFTYSSGTVTTTSSTLTISASLTMNTAGINFNNVTFSATTLTITNNSLLTVNGTLTIAATTSPTFAGSSAWTAANFTVLSIDARTITLVNNLTYTITTSFTCAVSRVGSTALITSDHATNKANLTVTNGATCTVLAAFTRVDASGGRTINTFNSTVTTCININSFTDLRTVSNAA